MLAFSEEQAVAKHGAVRWIVRYQAFLFFPLLLFEGIGLRVASLLHAAKQDARTRLRDAALMAAHITLYALLVGYFLGVWQASPSSPCTRRCSGSTQVASSLRTTRVCPS